MLISAARAVPFSASGHVEQGKPHRTF
jgi:hypothetical protein